MEDTMPRLLIETTVRQTLKGLQEDPKRSVRNLLDMALQFSKGRFQSGFFRTARTMLENENSAYYTLVQDAAAHIETEHLVRFGMNLGYNSCTWGAHRIRANEKRLGFNIPWTVLLSLDGTPAPDRFQRYHKVLTEGEQLGIYTWMLFAREIRLPELLALLRQHPDSAFFLFCPSGAVGEAFVEAAARCCNMMPVLCLDENAEAACPLLRENRLPYSVWLPYARPEAAALADGDLLDRAQQLHPVFTGLMPRPDCPPDIQTGVSRAVTSVRDGQYFATIPWEMYTDTCRLDEIISDDACWAAFDGEGSLRLPGPGRQAQAPNLFRDGLREVLRQTYSKAATLRPMEG